jgi:hypothetical protein
LKYDVDRVLIASFPQRGHRQGIVLSFVTKTGVWHNADLRNTNLEDANIQGANLERANLEGANLQGANLSDISIRLQDIPGNYSFGEFLQYLFVPLCQSPNPFKGVPPISGVL